MSLAARLRVLLDAELGQFAAPALARPGASEAAALLRKAAQAEAACDWTGAAGFVLAAQAAAPEDASLAFRAARLARHGLLPAGRALDLLVLAAARGPASLARRAQAAEADLLWERQGPVPRALALARRIGADRRTPPPVRLRAAALLAAGGETAGAMEIVEALMREGQGALVAKAGYLELVRTLAAAGLSGLKGAERATRVAGMLDATEGRFAELVAAHTENLALVANGASLAGRGLGPVIDAKGFVVRFNAFPDAPTDHGRRTDVWIRPHDEDHVPLRPLPGLSLLVATGCDPRHRFSDGVARLGRLMEAGAPLAVVPTTLYRRLFACLDAAPSAGLLGLAWAAEATGHPLPARLEDPLPATGPLTAAAFGYALDENDIGLSRYHDRVVAGMRPGRHAWVREARLFAHLAGGADAA